LICRFMHMQQARRNCFKNQRHKNKDYSSQFRFYCCLPRIEV
jgi:hypothetical protein